MRPCQRPTTCAHPEQQLRWQETFDMYTALHVAQLPYIVIPPVAAAQPAQEDVRCRLHQLLAHDDPLTLKLECAPGQVRTHLQDGRLCLLDLQEERITIVAAD